MPKMYTEDEVLAEINKEVAEHGLRGLARLKGISSSQLSDTRTRRVAISPTLAKLFGFERQQAEFRFRKVTNS